MKILTSLVPATIAAILAFAMIATIGHLAHAYNLGMVETSGDVNSLPQRTDIQLTPLAASDPAIKTSAGEAVSAAEREFGLHDSQIDQNIGVVRAIASIEGSPFHHQEKVWIVPVDVDTWGRGADIRDTVFHKTCIVIDVTTGRYEYAYQADPQKMNARSRNWEQRPS